MAQIFRGKWLLVTEPTGYTKAAVYAVRLVRRGRVVSIPRFLGVDSEGILTIGMTKQLESRRRRFIRGYSSGRGHSAANLLYPLRRNRHHKRFFQTLTFQFAFQPVPSAKHAKVLETKLTLAYCKRFGEAPPLSSSFAGRYAHFKDG